MKNNKKSAYQSMVAQYLKISKEKQLKMFLKKFATENQLKEKGIEILFLLSRICELSQYPHAAIYYYSEIIKRQNELEDKCQTIQEIEEIDNILDFSEETIFMNKGSVLKFVFHRIIKNLEHCGIKDEKGVAKWFGNRFENLEKFIY